MRADVVALIAADAERPFQHVLGPLVLPQPVQRLPELRQDRGLALAPMLLGARERQRVLVVIGGRPRLDPPARQIARVRERLDGPIGDRPIARVQVERGERGLFQVVRDRAWVAFGAARLRQTVRQTQVETLTLALGQALVRHVAQHLAPEPPCVLPLALRTVALGHQELGVLQLGQDVLARLGDERRARTRRTRRARTTTPCGSGRARRATANRSATRSPPARSAAGAPAWARPPSGAARPRRGAACP